MVMPIPVAPKSEVQGRLVVLESTVHYAGDPVIKFVLRYGDRRKYAIPNSNNGRDVVAAFMSVMRDWGLPELRAVLETTQNGGVWITTLKYRGEGRDIYARGEHVSEPIAVMYVLIDLYAMYLNPQ